MIEIQTQLRSACPVCACNFGYYFLAHGDEAQEQCKTYNLHQVLRSKFWGIRKPRSATQLNLYWSCCKLVAELLSDHENILDKDDVDFDVKIRVAKAKPAMIKRHKFVNNIYHMSYISIAFRNMKHLDACKYFDSAMPMLADMVGLDEDGLIEQAQSRMQSR